jgi:hypothetical protein
VATRGSLTLEKTIVNEGGQVDCTVRFRDRAGADSVPTTAEYRVYDLDNQRVITDWTSLGTMAADMNFTLDKDDTTLEGRPIGDRLSTPTYRRVLTVVADRNLATQVVVARKFRVQNVSGFSA